MRAFWHFITLSLISSACFAEITIPPEPTAPHIDLSTWQKNMPITDKSLTDSLQSIPTPTAWVFEFNEPITLSLAQSLIAQFHQKGVPAFITAVPPINTESDAGDQTGTRNKVDAETEVKISIGPEIDLNRLNSLETRVNIDPKLGTVRRFQIGTNTELTS